MPLLLNPVAAIALYLGVGALVLLTRLIAPNPRRAVLAEPAVETGEPQGELALEPATNNDNGEELAAAA